MSSGALRRATLCSNLIVARRSSAWVSLLAPRHLVLVVLVGMVVVLVIHSLHTEATYRLDFLWKLQATGSVGEGEGLARQPSGAFN